MNVRPVTVTKTRAARKAAPVSKYEEFEQQVFDTATVFSVSGYAAGAPRGTVYRRTFATLPEAIEHLASIAGSGHRCCIYAANPAGRHVVVDRAMFPKWLARWKEKRS